MNCPLCHAVMEKGEIGITNSGFNLLSQGVHWMEVQFISQNHEQHQILIPSVSRVAYLCRGCGASVITPSEAV